MFGVTPWWILQRKVCFHGRVELRDDPSLQPVIVVVHERVESEVHICPGHSERQLFLLQTGSYETTNTFFHCGWPMKLYAGESHGVFESEYKPNCSRQ